MTRKVFAIALVLSALVALFSTLGDHSNRVVPVTDPSANQLKSKSGSVDAPARTKGAQGSSSDPQNPVPKVDATQAQLPWIDELRSGPLSDVMRRHWRAAERGDADSMVIVHAIMGNCLPYRRRFEGKHIAEVRAQFAESNDPELIALNEAIWTNCADIYANWEKFDGWRGMISKAARLGQPYAMVELGWSQLDEPGTFSEGLAWITAALQTGDPVAISTMTGVYESAGAEPGISYGWLLAACDLGLDCSAGGALMANSCGPFSQPCATNESLRDSLIREHGDYGYWLAEQKATEILDAITMGEIGDLSIETDLRALLGETK